MAWVLVLVLGLAPPFLREAHTDIAWPFYLAEQILHGARQGVDFVEVNPPLFLWLAVPPVLLERLTGLGAWQFNVILTGLLAVLSLAVTNRLLSQLVTNHRHRRVLLLVGGVAALILPRISFSQREHLAFIAALPYVVLTAARLRGLPVPGRLALACGVLGGLGFSLKPHFLLAWLLVELLVFSRLRGNAIKRPELAALVAFGVIYFLVVVLFVPDYLPMAFRLKPWYDRYINNGIAVTAFLAGPLLLLTVLVVFAQRTAAREEDPLASSLCMAFLGFFAAAILQQKGFNYHFIAASGFGLVLLTRGLQVLGPGFALRPSALLARSGALLALVILGRASGDAVRELADPGARRYRTDPSYPLLLPVVKELAASQSLVVLSSNPAAGWPLTRDVHATWASRYMSLWPLPAIYGGQVRLQPPRIVHPHGVGQRPAFEQRFVDEVIADLERWRPRLIVVQELDLHHPGWGGAKRFDYLAYFGADPRFEALMRQYRLRDTVGGYGLWLREGP